MVWPEDADAVCEKRLEPFHCLGYVSGRSLPVGEVVAGGEGVGVVWPEDADAV
ncbi:hypothetical protein Lfu02_76410 [Longispora fulva]|uniref:Uncharacterized protein n=1 Tax=Longispora fulva TaxID=619741 RepID=A0A8J7KHE5_9ACTN|nr:hypothetical protein [Longispora fulva]GIG63269.1 hypothetical protein Lfu02_76410 [Longispora fulva]